MPAAATSRRRPRGPRGARHATRTARRGDRHADHVRSPAAEPGDPQRRSAAHRARSSSWRAASRPRTCCSSWRWRWRTSSGSGTVSRRRPARSAGTTARIGAQDDDRRRSDGRGQARGSGSSPRPAARSPLIATGPRRRESPGRRVRRAWTHTQRSTAGRRADLDLLAQVAPRRSEVVAGPELAGVVVVRGPRAVEQPHRGVGLGDHLGAVGQLGGRPAVQPAAGHPASRPTVEGNGSPSMRAMWSAARPPCRA